MHQLKTWDKWNVFSNVEHTSKIASVSFESRDLASLIIRNRHEYLRDAHLNLWKSAAKNML